MQNDPVLGEIHNLGVWKQGIEDAPPEAPPAAPPAAPPLPKPEMKHNNSLPVQPNYGLDV